MYTPMLGQSVNVGSKSSRDFFHTRLTEAREILVTALRDELAARGSVPDVDLENVASLVIAAMDGLQVQCLLDEKTDVESILRLIERILQPA